MVFLDAVKSCFGQYVGFGGRAPRSEFWYFQLFVFLVSILIAVIEATMMLPPVVSGVFSLGVLLPGLAVGARRLHDIGRSGWWLLLYLVPLLGFLILLFWFVKAGAESENKFGPNPLGLGNGPQDEVFAEN